MAQMTTLIHETRNRITQAAEGITLGAEELIESARDRATIILATLTCLSAIGLLLLSGAGGASGADVDVAKLPSTEATTVDDDGFTLSLPAGWTRSAAPDGSIFAASSAGGSARSTLWVEREPELGFSSFVASSLHGLQSIGTGVRLVDHVEGRTLETSSAQLRASVSLDGLAPAPYRVDLGAAGPYRYYLATQVAQGAPPSARAGAELLGSSLRPEVEPAAVSPAG